ncbi:multiple coagulation factor deficiency protein 2 homolog isoform X2 [Biomphalaria glabrata]|nr:multiple coagulation factor deficiency protein 2 homolog isoform X2 [Biomphalaria glabrata]XP_055879715.1 multiple coagulation factor deficiency protein 2 homolog isoform X2 [Biomphalaria glabrata]
MTEMTILTVFVVLNVVVLTSGHAGHGSHQTQQPQSFGDPNVIGDQEHLKQHMKGQINTEKPMTPAEMEFHYFRLHDTNNDTLLDGLEILKALSHMMPPMDFAPHEMNGKTAVEIEGMKNQRIREMMGNYVQIIDNVLLSDDQNKDGYLSYPEYSVARRRDAQRMKEMQEKMLRDANLAKEEMLSKQQQPYNTGL